MVEVEFLDPAQKELNDAFDYYEYQQSELGYRFVQEIYNTIALIKSYPVGWSKVSKNSRRCLVKSFPYGVIYQQRKDLILIVAIANLYRKPNYWAERLS